VHTRYSSGAFAVPPSVAVYDVSGQILTRAAVSIAVYSEFSTTLFAVCGHYKLPVVLCECQLDVLVETMTIDRSL